METRVQRDVIDLTECGVLPEGDRLSLSFRDAKGADTTLNVSLDQAGSLLMTLPKLIERALQTMHADPALRYVFPISDWSLEAAPDHMTLILNLKTPDGFAASFALSPEITELLASALARNIGHALPRRH